MPGAVHMVDIGFGKSLDAVARDQLDQALAMQDVEQRERTPPRAHFVHRRLVELAPLHGELEPVDAAEALLLRIRPQVPAYARAPVDDRAEDVEQAGTDVHQILMRM